MIKKPGKTQPVVDMTGVGSTKRLLIGKRLHDILITESSRAAALPPKAFLPRRRRA
ncbi:MAG: hypothetical protein K2P65_06335 [Lachnospiraceae bacterium]|nr:hypothetical protein [Lachnospiraceae bacterium]